MRWDATGRSGPFKAARDWIEEHALRAADNDQMLMSSERRAMRHVAALILGIVGTVALAILAGWVMIWFALQE